MASIDILDIIATYPDTFQASFNALFTNVPDNFSELFDEINTPLKDAICLSCNKTDGSGTCMIFPDKTITGTFKIPNIKNAKRVLFELYNDVLDQINFILSSNMTINSSVTRYYFYNIVITNHKNIANIAHDEKIKIINSDNLININFDYTHLLSI